MLTVWEIMRIHEYSHGMFPWAGENRVFPRGIFVMAQGTSPSQPLDGN